MVIGVQPAQKPTLGDVVYFVLYYSDPVPDDPYIVGSPRAAIVNHVNEDDGTVNLTYFTARQLNEPDNPPAFVEFKFRVPYDATGKTPRTWHYPGDVA